MTVTTRTWVATTSSAATPTVPASEPSPNSRPSATRSPSNPSPHDGDSPFRDAVEPGAVRLGEGTRGLVSGKFLARSVFSGHERQRSDLACPADWWLTGPQYSVSRAAIWRADSLDHRGEMDQGGP